MHIPVLLNEVCEYLNLRPGLFVIDGTVDGGGHAREILKRIAPNGTFLGIEWDERLLQETQKHFPVSNVHMHFAHGNYAEANEIRTKLGLPKSDALLLDLGFSSEELENGRGFSFQRDEPLIMTYDDSRKPVRDVLRQLKETELADVIFKFGEERFSRRIARAIKETLRRGTIETTGELDAVIRAAVPKQYERGRIRPSTRTFQALRIYANDELGNLTRILENLQEFLDVGARIAIVSFHSLEDRIVKTKFRELERDGTVKIITKKPVTASEAERAGNPRSRSAKLRVAEVTTSHECNPSHVFASSLSTEV